MKKNKCDDCCVGLIGIPFANFVECFMTDYYSINPEGNYLKDRFFSFNYCPYCGHKVVIKNDRHD